MLLGRGDDCDDDDYEEEEGEGFLDSGGKNSPGINLH